VRAGWTAGGGIESMLGSNWMARAEYRFADFGTRSNTDIRTGALGAVASYDLRLTTHTAQFGIAYKFDWSGTAR
jgi:outer membrane immunogenic protein